MNDILGVGIIGTGVVFDEHAAALESLKRVARLVGVAEIDAAKRAAATEKYFIPVQCDDYHELLARGDVDVIHICTPPCLHEDMIGAALEAGKYVVCEKPLVHTLDAADRIIRAAEKFPGKLSVIYQHRHLSEIEKIVWLRDQGFLGDLLYGNFVRYASLSRSRAVTSGWWGKWNVAGGGVVMTQFIHHLDQMYYLFGRPVEVSAVMDTLQHPIESEDTFAATVRFESGALVSCCSTVIAQGYHVAFEVMGSCTTVQSPWALRCTDNGTQRQLVAELTKVFPPTKVPSRSLPARVVRTIRRKLGLGGRVTAPPTKGVMHAAHFKGVFDAIHNNQPLPVSAEEARVSLDLCIGIYSSAMTGQRVSLPLDSSNPLYRGITVDDYQNMTKSARTCQPTS